MQATAIQHNRTTQVPGRGPRDGHGAHGARRKTAVVDADLRAFDHPNLFIEGSAVFPTGGAANPTLTIAALALRSVDAIRATLAT